MDQVPLLFIVSFIGLLIIITLFDKIRSKNESVSNGVDFHGQINFISQCKVVVANDKIIINSDFVEYNEIRYENIKRIVIINFLIQLVLMTVKKPNGKIKKVFLNIDAPKTFYKTVQSMKEARKCS